MNYSELLHDFLENSLSGANEETLFHALAADEDLRFELKYLLKLKESIGEDDEAAIVPLGTTSAIFSKLGYAIPATLAAGGGAAATGLFPALRTWGGYLGSALAGALLTCAVFLGISGNESATSGSGLNGRAVAEVEQADGAGAKLSGAELKASELAAAGTEGTATMKSSSVAITPSPLRSAPQRVVNSAAGKNRNESTDNGLSTESPSAPKIPAIAEPTPPPAFTQEGDQKNQAKSVNPSEPLNVAESDLRSDGESDQTALTSDLQDYRTSYHRWGGPQFRIGLSTSVLNNNMTTSLTGFESDRPTLVDGRLSLDLEVASRWSIILEGGVEPHFMSFVDVRDDGRQFVYESEPNLGWWGVGGKYSLGDRTAKLTPFVQGTVGGSEAGYVGHGMIGTEIRINNHFSASLGLDGSTLMYGYKGDDFFSNRIGLTAGLLFGPLSF